jgi:hypothetical protein
MRVKLFVLMLITLVGFLYSNWVASGAFFANVICPNIVFYSVAVMTFIGIIVGIGYTFKNSSVGGGIIAFGLAAIVIVIGSSAIILGFGESQYVTATLCNNCSDVSTFGGRLQRIEGEEDKSEQVEGYRKLEAAVDDFIEVEKDREAKIPADVPKTMRPKVCVADGELFSARVLLSKLTNVLIPGVRNQKPKDSETAQICSDKVAEANQHLERADALVMAHNGDQQMVQLIKTHRETLDEAANKCALPDDRSITVLDKRMNSPHYEVDVKVFDGDGSFVPNAESIIEVWRASENIEAKVDAINGGEPLCLAVVADNSQSIVDPDVNPDGRKNLEYISQALTTLNELRKSDDYYSLITFGGPNEIVQVRNLDKSGVPTDKIDAKGGNTAIWDAVKVGIDQLSDCRYPKRTLLLLTDGEDNSSVFMKTSPKTPPAEIVKALNKLARDKGIFFNILAVGPAVKNPDLKSFDTTSGAFIALNDFAGLSAKISEMVGAQQNFYRIHIPLELLGDVKLLKLRITGGTSEVTVEIGNS